MLQAGEIHCVEAQAEGGELIESHRVRARDASRIIGVQTSGGAVGIVEEEVAVFVADPAASSKFIVSVAKENILAASAVIRAISIQDTAVSRKRRAVRRYRHSF